MLMQTIDVLGLGIVTVDDVLVVPGYPAANTKVNVRRSMRSIGGLTGAALVAAARLGAHCAYAGVLGEDELSDFVRESLRAEGIDLSCVDPSRHVAPIHSHIVVDESTGSRTIFFELPRGATYGGEWPELDLIARCKVLHIDHYDAERTLRAAESARGSRIPVVADLERSEGPLFDALLRVADHLIVGRDFAASLLGDLEPERLAEGLWHEGREVVIVTCGERGAVVRKRGTDQVEHYGAYRVAAVDTTGCGDVFHGAYDAGLAWGWPLEQRMRLALAAAALRATKFGADAGIPRFADVAKLMKQDPGEWQ
jgi:ribokinase